MMMKQALFYTILFVFAATAVITLLGIVQVVQIETGYLDKLFGLLLVEAIAPVTALFKKTDFFGVSKDSPKPSQHKLNIVLLPKDSFKRAGDPHECTFTILNPETDEEDSIDVRPIRANGYLSASLGPVTDDVLIRAVAKNAQNEAWESEFFSPTIAKAEMVKI